MYARGNIYYLFGYTKKKKKKVDIGGFPEQGRAYELA